MSFTFNGIKKGYLRALVGIERPAWAPIEEEIIEIPGRAGGIITEEKIKVRRLNIPVRVYKKGFASLEDVEEDLAAWLITDDPKPLTFSHKPDRTYHAKVTGELVLDEYPEWGEGVISFLCPDPYKYGPEIQIQFTSDVFTLTNNGTAETSPTFELEVLKPVTLAMIQNQDNKYMMIGQPHDVTQQQPYVLEERVMWDEMNNLTGWTATSSVEGGIVSGNITTDGYRFLPQSFGEGANWHGPALKTSIPGGPLQDFKIDAVVEFWNTNQIGDKVGKLEIDLLNGSGKVVAKLSLSDTQFGANLTVGQARSGSNSGANHYLINESGDLLGVWNNFYGLLRILRKGNYWEAYICLIDQTTGRHHTERWASWTDMQKTIMDSVAQVQIYMAQFETNPAVDMAVHDIKVWRLNQDEVKVPYIANVGDKITFDMMSKVVLINGEPMKKLKQLGATYFTLNSGNNQLVIMPRDSFRVNVKYRERYL